MVARRRLLLELAAAVLAAGLLGLAWAAGSTALAARGDPRRQEALVNAAVHQDAWLPRLALWGLVSLGEKGVTRRAGLALLHERPEDGRAWLEQAAWDGDARAAYALALWWRSGEGGPRDQARALPWLERAAEGGLGAAHFLLGNAYRDGDGVARDLTRALRHYQLGAELEDPQALQTLAEAYRVGELGLTADPEKAEALRRDLDHAVHEARPPL